MATPTVLNASLGISDVLPELSGAHLPELDGFAPVVDSNVIHSLHDYKIHTEADSFIKSIAANFAPEIESNDMLESAALKRNLGDLYTDLSGIRQREVRAFVREDLEVLMENQQLLQLYLGMMVTG